MNQQKYFFSICRSVVIFSLSLVALFCSAVGYADFAMHLGGAAGIESGSLDTTEVDDQGYSGLSLSGIFGIRKSYFEGDVGLGYIRWSYSANNTDVTFSQFFLGLEAGIGITPLTNLRELRLSSLIGYEFGFYGSVSTKSGSTNISTDTDGYGRLTHTWRTLYDLSNKLSIGADLKFMRGSMEYSIQSVRVEPEFSAWSLRLFVDREI